MKSLLEGRRNFLKQAAAAGLLRALPEEQPAGARRSRATSGAARGTPAPAPKVHLDVRSLGAVGDGKTKDTLAVQQALDRCSLLGGGDVLVPPGDFLVGALSLRANTTLRLAEGASLLGSPDLNDYPLTQVRWEGRWVKGYGALLSATDARNIAVAGKGKIVASDAIKGRLDRQTRLRNPALMEFTSCRNVRIEDCFTQGNDMWSIHPVYCEDVAFRNVAVHGGADGIDVDSCKGVVIDGCDFVTGDDCISLKSGRGFEGNTIGRVCEEVRISRCTFSDSHWACIGIGSETSGGIRHVQVDHCKCLGAKTFAVYIKSRPGRGAFIEDISLSDLDVSGAQLGFLRINMLNSGLQDAEPVPGDAGIPTVRNFRFSNIRVTDVPTLVDAAAIHPHKPLEGFSLTNVTGSCGKGILLANVRGAILRDIKVRGFTGPLLSTCNVTGTGLTGAAPLEAPMVPEAIPPRAEPYILR